MVRESFDVRCSCGIPFPGKGTMSYNCDDDGLFGTAFDVEPPEEACVNFGDVVLEYRKQYGSQQCRDEPWKQSAQERIREYETHLAEKRNQVGVDSDSTPKQSDNLKKIR